MATQSEEYLESVKAVAADQNDVTSWLVILDQVERGKGGTATVSETFSKFLKIFPRHAKTYGRLAHYYTQNAQTRVAEELLSPCLSKLRNVEIWLQYIKIVKRLIPKDIKDENFASARKTYESAYEMAIDNVGYSVESGILWKEYLGFLNEQSDATMDPVKKRESIRKAYQRALTVPNEALDELWRGYDQFERLHGAQDMSVKEALPEIEKKYMSAKALYRERKIKMEHIAFDRLAVPYSRSRLEFDQLQMWNRWLRYERTNPDNLPPDAFKSAMQLAYEQCLCCMRFHPEVWISLAKFKVAGVAGSGSSRQRGGEGVSEARKVLIEAIETLPNVALLRVAYSEIEEHYGSVDNARKILDSAFEALPCGLLFAVRQRFIRRREGLLVARQCFSETLAMRLDKRLGYEVYVAHAQLELDVNCQPAVAVKVLELARAAYPSEAASVSYVRLLARALLRLGDLSKIRWEFSAVLGAGGAAAVPSVSAGSGGVGGKGSEGASGGGAGDSAAGATAEGAAAGASGTATGGGGGGGSSGSGSQLPLADQLELWEDFLSAETILGVSGVERLDELRRLRDEARAAHEDRERSRTVVTGAVAIAAAEVAAAARAEGLFDSASELLERYGSIGLSNVSSSSSSQLLPEADAALVERCRSFVRAAGGHSGGNWSSDGGGGMESGVDGRAGGGRRRWDQGGGAGAEAASAADQLLGVPPALRSLINKLPPYLAAAPPDLDSFTRSLRSLVLPPRPAFEGGDEAAYAGMKRGADWLSSLGNEDDDAAGDDLFSATRDDVFRQRQRARLY